MFALYFDVLLLLDGVVPRDGGVGPLGNNDKDAREYGSHFGTGLTPIRRIFPKLHGFSQERQKSTSSLDRQTGDRGDKGNSERKVNGNLEMGETRIYFPCRKTYSNFFAVNLQTMADNISD